MDRRTSHFSLVQNWFYSTFEKNRRQSQFNINEVIWLFIDKCDFTPVKTKWDINLVEFGNRQMGLEVCCLNKERFCYLLRKTICQSIVTSNISSRFKLTEIFPVNTTQFQKELFDKYDLNCTQLKKIKEAITTYTMKIKTENTILEKKHHPKSNCHQKNQQPGLLVKSSAM